MLNATQDASVYLACGSTDLRKSIDALAALVVHQLDLDVFSRSLFVFCNGARDKLKILYWDGSGFWLCYRRLEGGRFRWPTAADARTVKIARRQLEWLLGSLTGERRHAVGGVGARIAA